MIVMLQQQLQYQQQKVLLFDQCKSFPLPLPSTLHRALLLEGRWMNGETASVRECVGDFINARDWRDGDVLLHALDHGMMAPKKSGHGPKGATEKGRAILSLLKSEELLDAMRKGMYA